MSKQIILYKYLQKRSLIKNVNNGHHNIGCVIFDKSHYCIYAFGYNQYNMGKNFLSIHAEHHAINNLRFSKKKKKVDIIIFRICNKGENILCGAPCETCQKRMREGIIKKGYVLNRIYYTNETNDNFECIKKNDLK